MASDDRVLYTNEEIQYFRGLIPEPSNYKHKNCTCVQEKVKCSKHSICVRCGKNADVHVHLDIHGVPVCLACYHNNHHKLSFAELLAHDIPPEKWAELQQQGVKSVHSDKEERKKVTKKPAVLPRQQPAPVIEISIPKAYVINSVGFYTVTVKTQSMLAEQTVLKRFRQFDSFDTHVRKEFDRLANHPSPPLSIFFSSSPILIPKLPPKKFKLTTDHLSEPFLEYRRQALLDWLLAFSKCSPVSALLLYRWLNDIDLTLGEQEAMELIYPEGRRVSSSVHLVNSSASSSTLSSTASSSPSKTATTTPVRALVSRVRSSSGVAEES